MRDSLPTVPMSALALSLWMAGHADAATIERYSDPVMGCDILVSGTIASGDAEALRTLLAASDQEIAQSMDYHIVGEPMIGMRPPGSRRVCFNSNGGSFSEGLRMAEVLIEYRKGSAVGPNMICESACALAFMGGSTAVSQVERSDDTDRVLHPNALLGFHAPSLVIQNGQYDEATVAQAYGVALAALRALSEARNTVFRGYVPGTDQATFFRYRFPESLLLEMLGTPPDQMRYVRTVAEASRWDIRIGPIRFPSLTAPYARFAAACDNIVGYWSELTEFYFQEPPFLDALLDAQNGGIAEEFEVQAAGSLSAYGGWSQPNAWRGVRDENGLRLIANLYEYIYECDVEIFSYEQAIYNPFIPVGAVIFGSLRYFYPFQLFDPATEISILAPQPGPAFDINNLISDLTAEVAATMAASAPVAPSFGSCWLTSPTARVINVNEYVNLRRRPDFSAPVIRQVPLGERVRAQRADNITIIGQERDRQSCINACQAFSRNAEDHAARDRAQQCINDNMLWYEVTDARGNRGWVSRKFLEEAE
jgi:hypothetical protein